MKIEKKNLENNEIQLDVELDADEFAPYQKQAAQKLSGAGRIAGFRPGKAPFALVKQYYGDAAIDQQALDLFLDKGYADVLKQAEVEPGGMGRMEKLDQTNPPKFTIIVPLPSSVDLKNYRDIREDYKEPELTDEEVQKTVDDLKHEYAEEEPVDGPAEDGMVAFTMIKAETDDPEAEGGKKEVIKEMPYDFEIGKDTDEKTAWPFAGFTKNLIGAKADDVITTEHEFGEDSQIPSLKGKKVTFTTKIQSVKKLVLPEETAEFAKNFGKYESFDELKETIRKNLQSEKINQYKNEFNDKILDKMVEGAEIKFAPEELDKEVKSTLEDFKRNLSRQRIDLDTYLKVQKKDLAKFMEEDVKPVAEKQLKRNLVVEEFAKVEKLQINSEKFKEISKNLEAMMKQQYGEPKTNKQKSQLQSGITEQALNESFAQTVFDRMKAIALGENPTIEEPKTAEEEGAKAAAAAADSAVVDSTEIVHAPDEKKESEEQKPEEKSDKAE